jgi:hypothetical protein
MLQGLESIGSRAQVQAQHRDVEKQRPELEREFFFLTLD